MPNKFSTQFSYLKISNCTQPGFLIFPLDFTRKYIHFQKKVCKVSVSPLHIFCQPAKMGGKSNMQEAMDRNLVTLFSEMSVV